MANRVIQGNSGKDFPPTVQIKAAPGVMFKGKLISVRQATTTFGVKPAYLFKIIDVTAPVQRKVNGAYVEADVAVGAEVEIFAPPSVLAGQLAQVQPGETVLIVNRGKGVAKAGKNAPHLFDVSVVDA